MLLPPLLLLVAGLFVPWACYKESPEPTVQPPPVDYYSTLPEPTQTGANTFGCKVNGEVWVPRVPLFSIYTRDIEALLAEKNHSGVGTIRCNLIDTELQIDNWFSIAFDRTNFSPGSYCGDNCDATFRTTFGKYYDFYSGDISDNCVHLTKIDTVNNIISGTFEFTLYRDSLDKQDKIKITEGRFDVHYYPD